MNQQIIRDLEMESMKPEIADFNVGDNVRVHIRITEGKRERIQIFEGLVIKRQGGGIQERFTVRKLSYGIGVEKTFPLHSPMIEKIEVVRTGKVRRARLFYIRDRVGKSAKVKQKITRRTK
ncbi:MAG: 50S ribosomal protein L19 [Tissierellia bacterium]|jgi:large subunit ribosomal protein L19|nr:50S ribosomal protein L19 [Tissierellia bacterium]